MAENLRRGFARHYFHERWEDVEALGPHLHVKGSGLDSDVIYYFDSETHWIYSATRNAEGLDSDRAWHIDKVVYKSFDDGWTDTDADLLNAFGAKTYFQDKQEVYDQGPIFKINAEHFFVDDSEQSFWKKIAEPGTQSSHYTKIPYHFLKTRIKSAKSTYGWQNQTNLTSFTLFEPYGQFLMVDGTNIIDDNTGRLFKHSDFVDFKPASIWVRDLKANANVNLTNLGSLTSATLTSKIASTYNCYGPYYRQAVNDDSELLIIGTDEFDRRTDYSFHYMTELGDSETRIEFNTGDVGDDSDFPQVLDSEGDFVITSFTTWDGTEEPWKVFNDSDNSGFKASLGVQSGWIGYDADEVKLPYQYNLMGVLVENTPATVDQNRPYNFTIEGRTRDDVWEVIETVQGFDGYTYNKRFDDSDYIYFGFRVNVTACQPDFDPALNALEIKSIRFTVSKETPNIYRKGRGFWLTTVSGSSTFWTGDSEVAIEGALLGGGAGGYSYLDASFFPHGGGGGGGCYVQIDDLILPPNRQFELKSGDGGNDSQPGQGSYIKDLTSGLIIAEAGGGQVASEPPNNQSASIGGAGGTATIDNVNYTISTTVINGSRGGTVENPDDQTPEGGLPGHTIALKSYASPTTYTVTNVNVAAGGGAGSPLWPGGAAGGTSAGQGTGRFTRGTHGTDQRGGGGGGAGTLNVDGAPRDYFEGRMGGSGFAYIIFK